MLCLPSTLCLDTRFTSSDKKISGFTRPHVIGFVADLFFSTLAPSTRYRIRCGFIFFHFGPVHTLSDSLRIYFFPLWPRLHVIGFVADIFFPLWRADLFFSGFAVESVSGKKKLRIPKYPDTCGRGLKHFLRTRSDDA